MVVKGELININLVYDIIAKILIIAMLAVTIFSGYDYIIKNKDVLKDLNKKTDKKKKNKK